MIKLLQLDSPKDVDFEELLKSLDKSQSDHGTVENLYNCSYLHIACLNPNCFKLVQLMVENGHDLSQKDKLGATPIFYAAANPEPRFLEYLVEEQRQYLRVYDKKNNTPLVMAIIARRSENIHYILQTVPSAIKDKSILRMTPLNVACRNGYINTIRTLMSYPGSSPNQPGGWDKLTPL